MMKTLIHALICTIILALTMWVFSILNYIDFSVVRAIYLPIYAVIIVAILFRQYLFCYVLTVSAGLGLMVEYLVRSFQEFPTMAGSFANTLILILGFVSGIVTQIIKSKKHTRITGDTYPEILD
jgi:hypothetical protein